MRISEQNPDDQPSNRETEDGAVEVSLPADDSAPGRARRYVTQRWSDLDDDTLGDVELIVSELVTNAVRHGAPEITLRLRHEPFAIDVGVFDQGDGMPRAKTQDEVDGKGSGRGLMMIDRLAAAWECSRSTNATASWCGHPSTALDQDAS